MGQIANKQWLSNNFGTNSGTDSTRCPMAEEYKTGDLKKIEYKGSYSNKQLVQQSDVKLAYRCDDVIIDQNIVDSKSRIYGDVNGPVLQWIRQNTHRVHCKKIADGVVKYCRLDDTDSRKFYDGSIDKIWNDPIYSSITWYTHEDIMVKMPTFYYKGSNVGDLLHMYFADGPVDSDFIKWDGNNLIGAFKSCRINKSGNESIMTWGSVPKSADCNNANGLLELIKNSGTGYQLLNWQTRNLIFALEMAMLGTTIPHWVLGEGSRNHYGSCGVTLKKGMTDTKYSPREYATNFLGLENTYDSGSELISDGIIYKNTNYITVNDVISGGTRKIYHTSNSEDPGSFPVTTKLQFGKYMDIIPLETIQSNKIKGWNGKQYYSIFSHNLSSYLDSPVDKDRYCWFSQGNSLAGEKFWADPSFYSCGGMGSFTTSRIMFTGTVIEEPNIEIFKSLTSIF